MGILNKLFGKKYKLPLEGSDPNPRDDLLDWKKQFIYKKSLCPDCKTGKLFEWPSGGGSTNILCGECLSEFNWSAFSPQLIMAHRNGKASTERAKRSFGVAV